MARIVICGTLAYDDIGVFDSPLTAATRNVKLERLHRGFGGCAMNIAYNLAALGHEPVPFVYAGDDYADAYAQHVAAAAISRAGIFPIPGTPCARGIVLTGRDGAQFTAFYPGPSGLSRWAEDLEVVLAGGDFDAAIIAPDLPEKMAGCASRLSHLPLLVWCPGQYAELLERSQIEPVIQASDLLVVNAHEWQALCVQIPAAELLAQTPQIVVTNGAKPVMILPGETSVVVPELADGHIDDPTGCGDAFAAALTAARLANRDMGAAVSAGIGLAARCIAHPGAQSHSAAP